MKKEWMNEWNNIAWMCANKIMACAYLFEADKVEHDKLNVARVMGLEDVILEYKQVILIQILGVLPV